MRDNRNNILKILLLYTLKGVAPQKKIFIKMVGTGFSLRNITQPKGCCYNKIMVINVKKFKKLIGAGFSLRIFNDIECFPL